MRMRPGGSGAARRAVGRDGCSRYRAQERAALSRTPRRRRAGGCAAKARQPRWYRESLLSSLDRGRAPNDKDERRLFFIAPAAAGAGRDGKEARGHGYRGRSGGAARADARPHRGGGRHRRARAGAHRRARQGRHADGLSAQHGTGAERGARGRRQDGERGARGGGGGAGRTQGGPRCRRAGRGHRRGGRGRDAAGPRPADGHAPPHQPHHRRDLRDIPRSGLHGGRGPRGGDRLLQLRGAQRPGRPSQPQPGRHVLRGGPLRRRGRRAR